MNCDSVLDDSVVANGSMVEEKEILKRHKEALIELFKKEIFGFKQREGLLVKKQRLLNRALQFARLGSWSLNLETGALTWDDEAYRIFGLKKGREELLYNDFLAILHPEDRERVNTSYEKSLINGNKAYELEHRIITRDTGEVRYVLEWCEHERDHSGKVLRSFGLVQDITEKKLAETALIESEERFQLLSDVTFEGIAIHKQGIIQDLNKSLLKMLSCEPIQIVGHHISEFIYPDDLPLLNSKLGEAAVSPYEIRLVNALKEVLNVEIEARNYRYGHEELRVVSIRDITGRKKTEASLRESEARYRNVFNDNHSVMLIVDPVSGAIKDANPAACSFYGWTHSELCHKNIWEINCLTREEVNAEIQKAQTRTRKMFMFKHRLANGEVRDVEVYSGPITFSGQNYLYSIVHDVSERKTSEKIIYQQNRELETINAHKDRFFSILAHDLRSPLSGVMGLSDLLVRNVRKYDLEKTEKFLRLINDSIHVTYNLLDDLLAWSGAQSGKLPFNPEWVKMENLCSEVIGLIHAGASSKNIAIQCSVPDGLSVYADNDMLRAILRNLVSNAVKFTNPGGIVEITARHEKEGTSLMVTDNGVGMEPDTVKNLFNAPVGQSTRGTSNEQGSGLGLMICKEFVTKHGGTIWAKSEPDQGSVFGFILPHPPKLEVTDEPEVEVAFSEEKEPAKPIKVLIADDNESSAVLLASLLDTADFELLRAKTGLEAVSLCRQHADLDLVLMDIKMPERNGLEATRAIRAFNEQVVIIMQTAFDIDEYKQLAANAGCNDYITKPVDGARLKTLLSTFFKFEK